MAAGIESRPWSMEDVVAPIDAKSVKVSGETLVGEPAMYDRMWIFEYAWIGAAALVALIVIVSALIGRAARDRSEDD